MFSGKVDERSAAEAASRGAQGFIGKPFDPRSLIESTKQLLPSDQPAQSHAGGADRRRCRSRRDTTRLSTDALRELVVEHRVGVLDPFFEALSYAGSFGFVWLAIALGISGFSWSRPVALDARRRRDPRRRELLRRC